MDVTLPRLRQVAVVARDLDAVTAHLERDLGLAAPYRDPGVAEFGLANAVYAVGDAFAEVVSPTRAGTTAGRYLDRRGGDSGYMAISQVASRDAVRSRLADAGIGVVWSIDLDDMAGTHVHPKDTPGAIVSIDWADPPSSWRWGGPSWTGRAPAHDPAGITALTVAVAEPVAAAARWAAAIGVAADDDAIALGAQRVRFTRASADEVPGIVEIGLALPRGRARVATADIAGVRFSISASA